MSRRALALLFLLVAGPALAADPPRKKIERADQLPTRNYLLAKKPSLLVQDPAAADSLALLVQRNLEADLKTLDIEDAATLRAYYGTLAQIAVLQGRYDDALAFSARVRDLQDKPALKLLSGTQLRALVASKKAPAASRKQVYLDAYRKELAALPYDQVQAELKAMKAGVETQSANLLIGMAEARLDPAVKDGLLPQDLAFSTLNMAYALREVLPLKDETVKALGDVVGAHTSVKPDIWAARSVALGDGEKLTPVVVAIWDSGVDVKLFPGKLWVNGKEIPANGKDDDVNGWVDDVNGIAFSWTGAHVPGVLGPVEIPPAALEAARADMKGYSELQAGIDSPEADAIKRKMNALPREQVKDLFEGLSFFGTWGHGTHVAGIATAGNPAARILVIRNEYPWQLLPPVPDDAWADGQARLMKESVRYLVAGGARVVNMSWGFTPKEFEGMLEQNRVGTPEERRKLALRWHATIGAALKEAMASAPGVLFVIAAGNSDADGRFEDSIPASFDLPNALTVGAVDRAGDEAAFTSYGKVDVYANGYQVESVVPGGGTQIWSGTSMAAPQVVNLAAKILARHPGLTVEQVKRLVVEGATPKKIGERTIRILDPRRSLEAATGK